MTLPGFNAETSMYKSGVHYRLMGLWAARAALDPAAIRIAVGRPQPVPCVPSCSPGAPRQCCWPAPDGTYQCLTVFCPPPPPDCNMECGHLRGCGRLQCDCDCWGGVPADDPTAPCGFRCVV